MTGRGSAEAPSRGAWWILILAASAVVVGLILIYVAGSGSGSDRAADAKRTGATRQGRPHRAVAGDPATASRPTRTRRNPAGGWGAAPVDRARLAALLHRGSGTGRAADPGAPGAEGTGGAGGAGGSGGRAEEEDATVWPLSAKGIRGAIRARIAEIKECYEGWLSTDDELGGKVVLAFTIEAGADGDVARVSNAEIQNSTVDHAGLERCILVMAESLQFEAPDGGKVTVRYPFRFRPGNK